MTSSSVGSVILGAVFLPESDMPGFTSSNLCLHTEEHGFISAVCWFKKKKVDCTLLTLSLKTVPSIHILIAQLVKQFNCSILHEGPAYWLICRIFARAWKAMPF